MQVCFILRGGRWLTVSCWAPLRASVATGSQSRMCMVAAENLDTFGLCPQRQRQLLAVPRNPLGAQSCCGRGLAARLHVGCGPSDPSGSSCPCHIRALRFQRVRLGESVIYKVQTGWAEYTLDFTRLLQNFAGLWFTALDLSAYYPILQSVK